MARFDFPHVILLSVSAIGLLLAPWVPSAAEHRFPREPPNPQTSPDSITYGVVWDPPEHPGPTLRQLNRISEMGATAIRLTSLPSTDAVFARADSLELRLFVDLPVSYVAAGHLADSLSAARPVLNQLLRVANRFSSLQAIGLGRYIDTTEPETCSVLSKWDRRISKDHPAVQTYYVTPFAASADACADAVDTPLFSPRGQPAPIERWRTWSSESSTVELGALGTWVTPTAASGLRVPHSPERQARYLENALSKFRDSRQPSPTTVFVYRWQDQAPPVLESRRYGLYDDQGRARPAADVVEGFYTGTQQTFAFSSGSPPTNTPVAYILLGWGLITVVGSLYAHTPFVRRTVYRYFAAHGFYRDAVREGRETSLAINLLLFAILGLAAGVIGAVCARVAGEQPATELVVAALPSLLRTAASSVLAEPVLLGTLLGGGFLLLLGSWTTILVLVGRFIGSLSVAQALMVVVWPCWPILIGMVLALVAATAPPLSYGSLGLLLLGGGFVAAATITARVLRDFRRVSNLPVPLVSLLALPSPLVLLLLAGLYLIAHYDLSMTFLWHLASRT